MVSVLVGHYQHLMLVEMNGKWMGSTEVRDFPMPTIMHFDLDSKILAAIPAAKETSLSYVSFNDDIIKLSINGHHMKNLFLYDCLRNQVAVVSAEVSSMLQSWISMISFYSF